MSFTEISLDLILYSNSAIASSASHINWADKTFHSSNDLGPRFNTCPLPAKLWHVFHESSTIQYQCIYYVIKCDTMVLLKRSFLYIKFIELLISWYINTLFPRPSVRNCDTCSNPIAAVQDVDRLALLGDVLREVVTKTCILYWPCKKVECHHHPDKIMVVLDSSIYVYVHTCTTHDWIDSCVHYTNGSKIFANILYKLSIYAL